MYTALLQFTNTLRHVTLSIIVTNWQSFAKPLVQSLPGEQMDKAKLTKTLLLLALLIIFVGSACRVVQRNSMTLTEYESLQGGNQSVSNATGSSDTDTISNTAASSSAPQAGNSTQTGASGSNESASSESTHKASSTVESQPSGMTENLQNTETTLTGALLNGDSQKDYRITYKKGFYFEPVSDSLQRYMTGVSYPGYYLCGAFLCAYSAL